MRIAVASDEKTHLTDFIIEQLHQRGHETILFGPLKGENEPWTLVSEAGGICVAKGEADEGIFFCYTGTGASIAANKVSGIRAALCSDAETARGARWWNDANVLVLSLRATSTEIAKEILDAWFSESVKPGEAEFVAHLSQIEARQGNK